jgi:flagellin-like protein
MDLKKLFKNSDAVSPVIGVILMVAITVILAAAIGSSVFGNGPATSAPQANFNIKAINSSYVTFEHLGGDPVNFGDSNITKVMTSIEGQSSLEIDATNLSTMSAGSVQNIVLKRKDTGASVAFATGSNVYFKVVDVKTNQLICNREVRF